MARHPGCPLWTTGSVRSVFLMRLFNLVSIMFRNSESGRSVWLSLSSSVSGARSARLDNVLDCVKLGIRMEMSGLKSCEALASTCRLRHSLAGCLKFRRSRWSRRV